MSRRSEIINMMETSRGAGLHHFQAADSRTLSHMCYVYNLTGDSRIGYALLLTQNGGGAVFKRVLLGPDITLKNILYYWDEVQKFQGTKPKPFDPSASYAWLRKEVQANPWFLANMPREHRTYELCREAVMRDGRTLKHCTHKTPDICLIAVSQDGRALAHIEDQTSILCQAAVENYPLALMFVKEQTEDLCIYAVQRCAEAFLFVNNHTINICLAALDADPGVYESASLRGFRITSADAYRTRLHRYELAGLRRNRDFDYAYEQYMLCEDASPTIHSDKVVW